MFDEVNKIGIGLILIMLLLWGVAIYLATLTPRNLPDPTTNKPLQSSDCTGCFKACLKRYPNDQNRCDQQCRDSC
jgi:hypothetical protein